MIPLNAPNEWLIAVLLVAAAWRTTHLFMVEAGPWHIITKIRAVTGVIHDDDNPIAYPDGNIFECSLCLSIWMSAAWSIVVLLGAWWLLVPWAVSAGAIWMEHWYGKS